MGYRVEVLAEVRDLDMPKLVEIDPALGRAVAELVVALQRDPWIGAEMRQRLHMEVLGDCRKIPFDVPRRKGKPRFRLVYRNDPNDGSIAVVMILAVGPRSDLEAYRRAAARRRGRA